MADIIVDQPRESVVRITLNRPARLNAMTSNLLDGLHDALDRLDESCRIIVITGAGRGFCSGLDLGGFDEHPRAPEPGHILAIQRRIASFMQRIRRLDQVVIAAVNGPATGGGLAIVCASDVRIATSSAAFAASFIRVGFSGCDMGVSWMLPRLVGVGRAHELMLTGRKVLADEALRLGLVTEVVPDDGLGERLNALCDDLLAAPALSLSLTKQGMWLSVETPSFDAAVELENRQQVITAMLADQQEAMAAFVDRRRPSYAPAESDDRGRWAGPDGVGPAVS
jgi:enoyl-CoA hydratase/carnithine racemase